MWNPFQNPEGEPAESDDLPFEIDEDEVPVDPSAPLDDSDASAVRDGLRRVIDPEVGVNIVDLGLVYAIEPTDDAVEIVVTATTPACPMSDAIRQDVERAARDVLGDDREVRVHLVFEPRWSPEFMSDEGREQLGGGGASGGIFGGF